MKHILLAALAAFAITFQAEAGELTAVNGKAAWKSTQCAKPVRPGDLNPGEAENNANALNEQVRLYNQYTAEVQSYMECVRQEAERDIAEAQAAAINDAQRTIQFVREENARARAQFAPDAKQK